MRCFPALALVAVAALPGCNSGGSAATADGGPAVSASPSAQASAAAPLPSDPVDACIAVMQREVSGDGNPDRAVRVANACAAVYRNPICRDAHERYGSRPLEERAMIITERCRAGYCPTLPEPKPKLCAEELPAPQEIAGMWFDLRKAIWKLDHGEETARKLELEHLRAAAQVQKLERERGGAH